MTAATACKSFARQYIADVEGWVRFVTPPGECAVRYVYDQSFEMEFISKTQRGEAASRFWVQIHRLRGRPDKVTLMKQRAAGDRHEAERYTVDCSFGTELGSLECNCKDFANRGRQRRVPHCKHTRGVRKVFDIIGVK